METKEIQKLIDYISKSDLDEVNIETAELKLHIKRNSNVVHTSAPQSVPVAAATVALPSTGTVEVQESSAAVVENAGLIEVKSPMIGTFYRSTGPGKPNFKDIGDDIAEGDVVCIVEAMKLFNEIESEISGRIVKILVDDASPIEYDQPLFLVDPS